MRVEQNGNIIGKCLKQEWCKKKWENERRIEEKKKESTSIERTVPTDQKSI